MAARTGQRPVPPGISVRHCTNVMWSDLEPQLKLIQGGRHDDSETKVTGKEGEWLHVRFSSRVTGYVKEVEAEIAMASQPLATPSTPIVAQEPSSPPTPPPLDQKAHDTMERALKPLRLLAAAMEAGMNYQQYGTRLVDAKMELEGAINDNSAEIPTVFKNETREIFDTYQDARLAWLWKIKQGDFCSQVNCSYMRDDTFVSSLLSKYPFLRSTIIKEAPGGIFMPGGTWANGRALSLLWAEAKTRTEKLAATIPSHDAIPASSAQSAEERLRNLKDLLDKKLITSDEYNEKRSQILKEF